MILPCLIKQNMKGKPFSIFFLGEKCRICLCTIAFSLQSSQVPAEEKHHDRILPSPSFTVAMLFYGWREVARCTIFPSIFTHHGVSLQQGQDAAILILYCSYARLWVSRGCQMYHFPFNLHMSLLKRNTRTGCCHPHPLL